MVLRSRLPGRRLCATAVAGLALLACDRRSDDGPTGFTRTDSAGVLIAWSAQPAEPGASGWSVSDAPTIVIGDQGDEAYTLYRVGPVTRLSGDRIAVADRGSQRVRIYDAHGTHLRDIGRAGDGPGEFRALSGIWPLPGDSLMVTDGGTARVTVFGPGGDLARTVSPEPREGAFERWVRRPFHDGTLLVESRMATPPSDRSGLWERGPWAWDRHAPDGAHLNAVGVQSAGLNWSFEIQGSAAYTSAPFSWFWARRASDGASLWEGDGATAQVRRVDPDGRLMGIVRWGEEPRAVTADVREQYRSFRLDRSGSEYRSATEAMLDGLPVPDAMPVYRSLLVDAVGCLWAERYRPDWETTARWWVFDAEGRWLGEPPLPEGLTLREVGADYLLGVMTDENGVERVVRYTLTR